MRRYVSDFIVVGLVWLSANGTAREQFPPAMTLFDQAVAVLKQSYVNPKHLDIERAASRFRTELARQCANQPACPEGVAEGVIKGFARALDDPHVDYASATVPRESFVGSTQNPIVYGFWVVEGDGILAVFLVQPGSQAEALGMRPGDRIVAVASETDPARMQAALLEGERWARGVSLKTVSPDGRASTITFDPLRRNAEKPSLRLMGRTAVLLVPTLGLPDDVEGFRARAQEYHDLVRRASEGGATSLILDLRGNNGGSAYHALSLACIALEETGRVYTGLDGVVERATCRGGTIEVTYSDEPGKRYGLEVDRPARWSGPLAVLTSRYTLSAAENLTDLLQRSGRAVVVGERTAGALGTSVGSKVLANGGTLYFASRTYTGLDGRPLRSWVVPDSEARLEPRRIATGADPALEAALAALR